MRHHHRAEKNLGKAGAFTLIELLVVVGIIGILCLLTMGGLSSARNSAQNVECSHRLRQIGIGLMQYVSDNDGYLLPGAIPDAPYRSWFNVLDPYMGGLDKDFSSGNRPKWTQCPSRKFPEMTEFTVGYGWNFAYFGFGSWAEEWASGYNSKLNSVPQPASTIIVGDSPDLTDPLQWRLVYPANSGPERMAHRHSGRGNYLFLDGHVSSYSAIDMTKNQDLFKKIKPPL